jgi:two-component system OmpR family sensor kinase
VSIRLRLTLLYSAILALTLILFSTVLYAAQSQYTLAIVQRDLAQTAGQIAMGWTRLQRDFEWRMPMPWMGPEGDRAREALQPLMREGRPRDMVHIRDAEGTPIDLPANQGEGALSLSQEGLKHLQNGEVWIETAHDEEGRVLVYNQPIVVNDEFIGIVQLSRSLADRDRSLQSLGIALLAGSALTTVVAFGIGWTLSGVTLRPIHRITRTAREIGQARDFSSRVEHTGPNDELGQLATTFNEMLSKLEDGYQQIARALQVQRDFVADVSHELRTPLTTIRGNLTLLERIPALPQAEQEDILRDLISESARLSRLVSDLLTLARADAGRRLELGPVDVQPLVEEVIRQARILAPGREIDHDGENLTDLTAYANEDVLKQVLLILLDNAIKHTDGPIRVSLADGDQRITIRVQDSGPGMPDELQSRIFDRFYRGDLSRTTPGFGLGLSIARALAEAQQGTVTVESEIGKGSTFVVSVRKAEEYQTA